MSSASEIVTPSKPRSRRSRSVITARDSVPGRSSRPVTAGSAMCPDIASRAPAAKRGTERHELAVVQHGTRAAETTARPWCVSLEMCPIPGACLTVAATPAAWRPRTIAAPCAPDCLRRVAERPDPERRVGGVRGEIQDRRVDHVDAHRSGLGTDRVPDPLRERRIVDRAQGHVPGERRRARHRGR